MPNAAPVYRNPRQHERQQQRQQEAARFHNQDTAEYRLARWRKFRETILAHEPLCRECARQGYIVPATDVDHIVRVKLNPASMYDPAAVQPLCHICHSRKTGREGRNE